jgi:hypothetical protein
VLIDFKKSKSKLLSCFYLKFDINDNQRVQQESKANFAAYCHTSFCRGANEWDW